MKTLLILTAVVVCFSAYAAIDSPHNGAWTAEIDGDSLQVTMFVGHSGRDSHRYMNNIMGFTEPLVTFAGLSSTEAKTNAANVNFEMRRPAGTIAFDGRFSDGTGAGHFRFTPDPAFLREMETLGYSGFTDDQLLVFTAHSFSPQTIRDLRSMGYQPTQREVEDIAIFRITADLLREYARLGYPSLRLREAVDMRVGHVDAAFIAGMRELGYNELSARQIADMGVLGVKPSYIRELQNAGLRDVPARQLTDLRVGHVTAERVTQYRRLGYDNLSASQLSEMGIHGVTPKLIEEFRTLGYDRLPVRQLVEMKIFGVTPDYVRRINSRGYDNVPLDKLMKMKQSGLVK